ncbi:ATP-binding cassette transporter snq2, partial [Tilletia horrida]
LATLTGCTDPNERRLVKDSHRFTASDLPIPQTLEQAYKESKVFKREVEQRNKFAAEQEKETAAFEEFRQAVRADKHRGVSMKSQYTIPLAEKVCVPLQAPDAHHCRNADQHKLDFGVVCIFLVGLVAMVAPLVEVF